MCVLLGFAQTMLWTVLKKEILDTLGKICTLYPDAVPFPSACTLLPTVTP